MLSKHLRGSESQPLHVQLGAPHSQTVLETSLHPGHMASAHPRTRPPQKPPCRAALPRQGQPTQGQPFGPGGGLPGREPALWKVGWSAICPTQSWAGHRPTLHRPLRQLPRGQGRQAWGGGLPTSSVHDHLRTGSCYSELLNRACALSRLELLPLAKALSSEPASSLTDRRTAPCLLHRGRRLMGAGGDLQTQQVVHTWPAEADHTPCPVHLCGHGHAPSPGLSPLKHPRAHSSQCPAPQPRVQGP